MDYQISLPTDYGDIPLEGAENIDVAKVSNINSEGRFHKTFEKRTFPIEKLSKFVGESVPVIEKSNKKLLGIISENDVLEAYLKVTDEINQIEKN